MKQDAPVVARHKRAALIFVCRKCCKRAEGGKAIRKALKSGLRDGAEASSRRKPRLVMTGCLKICPKRAIVVADGALLSRGEVLLVDETSAGQAAQMLTAAR